MSDYGTDRQRDVYLAGAAGETPEVPPVYEKLRDAAREEMSQEAYGYVEGSAGSEDTTRENREAFRRWRLVPDLMNDVSERDLSTTVLGDELDVPFLLAPVGVLSIVHDGAESAVARAASSVDAPFVLSTVSSDSMEEVAEETGEDTPRWFQLYPSSDPELNRSLLRRAEESGYSAVVVTVDTPLLGWRERDIENAYLPFLDAEGLANYFADPFFRSSLDDPPEENEFAAVRRFIDVFSDATLTPETVSEIVDMTDLPVVVKGVLKPENARSAVEAGADGVVVSNHGGRQVDGAVGALDSLPRVTEAVPEDAAVLFDSGVRRGADALKALALGADAVMLGRPYVYGLGLNGEDGVREVVKNFRADLDLTLGLTGCASVDGIDDALLRESPRYR
jgi:isopentenyl diphosphate isomerase/L-lactate dehydrogenase-like FMN-dependent dehydrogenase